MRLENAWVCGSREGKLMAVSARKMVEDYADECIRCGICTRTDCGNYGEGTPNLGDICESILSGDETWRHFPFTCALCNRCTVKCPVGLSAIDANKPLRAVIMEQHPELAQLYRKFRTDLKYNLFSTLAAKNRGNIEDVHYIEGAPDLGEDADHTAFFPGCALYAYAPQLTDKVYAWLREEKIAAYKLTFCCGATFFDVGFFEEFEAYAQRVKAFLAEHEITRLVYTCPHCGYELPQLLEGTGVELVVLSDLLKQHGKLSDFDGVISFHDACYDRGDGKFRAYAQALYPQAQISEMEHNHDEGLCCGGGGMVSCYAFDYCTYRRNQRLAEIDAVEADRVLSTCFSCVNSLQRGEGGKPMQHYLEPVFDEYVDWNAVYASVDALYADPAYEELTSRDDKTFD